MIQLRGQLRVDSAQQVFDCMVDEPMLLDALGAAKALMDIEGEPPSSLLTFLSKGPVRHINKYAYNYERCITRQIVLIQRVKEIQVRYRLHLLCV